MLPPSCRGAAAAAVVAHLCVSVRDFCPLKNLRAERTATTRCQPGPKHGSARGSLGNGIFKVQIRVIPVLLIMKLQSAVTVGGCSFKCCF